MILRSFLLIAVCMTATAFAADDAARQGPWSKKDIDTTIDAVLAIVDAMPPGQPRASILTQLIDNLERTGFTERNREILIKAGGYLKPLDNFSPMGHERVVQSLARLGDTADAEAIANKPDFAPIKGFLLGKVGEGRAQAGDAAYAEKIAAQIAKAGRVAMPGQTNSPSAEEIVSKIAIAVASKGDTKSSVRIAATLPDGLPKLLALSQAAQTACPAEASMADLQEGRDLANQAVTLARKLLNVPEYPLDKIDLTGDSRTIVISTQIALAECFGLREATWLSQSIASRTSAEMARDRLFGQLVSAKRFDMARGLPPPPDPADVESLMKTATQRNELKDNDGAVEAAKMASKVALAKIGGVTFTNVGNADMKQQLNALFYLLVRLGDYDTALATIQPIDPANRQVYYESAVRDAALKHNVAALGKITPAVVAMLQQPVPHGRTRFEIARLLAELGYPDDARRFLTQTDLTNAPGNDPMSATDAILLRADLGDVAGALAAVGEAGPLTAKPTDAQIALRTILAFDGAKNAPTPDEIAEMAKRVRAAMPAQVAGPQARLLSAMVGDLTEQGNIAGAQNVAAALESDPNTVLASLHDDALSRIATAQIKSGDPRGALATVLKIGMPLIRYQRLVDLAGIKPNM